MSAPCWIRQAHPKEPNRTWAVQAPSHQTSSKNPLFTFTVMKTKTLLLELKNHHLFSVFDELKVWGFTFFPLTSFRHQNKGSITDTIYLIHSEATHNVTYHGVNPEPCQCQIKQKNSQKQMKLTERGARRRNCTGTLQLYHCYITVITLL